MRPTWIVALSLAAGSIAGAPALLADESPTAPKAGPEAPKAGNDPKKDDAKKDDVVARVERAKQLVKELEDSVARVKAAPAIDAFLLQKLMEALDQAKALAKPAKPAELTADEKKAVIEDAKQDSKADPAPKDPMADWQEKAMARALEGADLSEEESIKAKKIVGDWYKENLAAMGDSKKVSDLKRKRDDDLDKALGKKSRKVINNLNSMGPGRR